MFKSPFILVHFVYFTCWYFLLHLLILLTSPVDTSYFTCWYFLLHLLILLTLPVDTSYFTCWYFLLHLLILLTSPVDTSYFTCWYFLLYLLILLTSPVDTFYFTCWYFLLHLLIRFTSFSGFFLNSESSAFPYLFHQIFFFSFSKYAEHWTLNCKAIWNMNTRKQLGKQIFLNKIVAYL